MTIKEFIQKVLNTKSNKSDQHSLGVLTEAEIEKLKEKTGFDLKGYTRVIDKFGVIHTIKKHGDSKREESQGQVAVTPRDFEIVPDIVRNADEIENAGKNNVGNDVIKYTKEYENKVFYLEEKRDCKKGVKQYFWGFSFLSINF